MENRKPVAEIAIALLIIGALVPVAGSLIGNSVQPTCYPIPSFLIPFEKAYAWSYYFNTTNHRWYNASSTNVNEVYYNFTSQDRAVLIGADVDRKFVGQYVNGSSALVGKTINHFSLFLDTDGTPTGNARVGIFTGINTTEGEHGTLTEVEAVDFDTSVLHQFDPVQEYTFDIPSHILQANEAVGIYFVIHSDLRVYYQLEAVNHDLGVAYVQFGNEAWNSLVFDKSDGPYDYIDSIIGFNGTQTTYTLIPLDGSPYSQTQEGRFSCSQGYTILWYIFIIAMIVIILVFLIKVKRDRK